MKFSIDSKLASVSPDLHLGIISGEVIVNSHNSTLWNEILETIDNFDIRIDQIASLPQVAALRTTYKGLGKKPTAYRGSNEALLRRISKNQGLYKVNNVVDINNLVSLRTLRSVGTYDIDKLQGPFIFCVGEANEFYEGIGKGNINISNLPVFRDAKGPFGSPTSDSKRAMIQLKTKRIIQVIISFDGNESLEIQLNNSITLLSAYADFNLTEKQIISFKLDSI